MILWWEETKLAQINLLHDFIFLEQTLKNVI